jgi:hypothetical protein
VPVSARRRVQPAVLPVRRPYRPTQPVLLRGASHAHRSPQTRLTHPPAPTSPGSGGSHAQRRRTHPMTWFKVDDSFHSHPKVLAAEPAALGLWVVAGAWCSANLTDGFVPDYVLPRLLPDSGRLAGELVTCGLWRRTKGGYRFHDWSTYQPTKEEATAQREKKSSGGALGNHRRWHTGAGKQDPRCAFCQQRQPSDNRSVTDRPTDTGTETVASPPDPTRPDPIKGGLSSSSTHDRARAGTEPPSKCPDHEHLADPPPCGRCAGLRRARDEADVTRRARIAAAPQCRRHRGQPADNCAPCRSEALAPPTGAFPVIVRSSSAA